MSSDLLSLFFGVAASVIAVGGAVIALRRGPPRDHTFLIEIELLKMTIIKYHDDLRRVEQRLVERDQAIQALTESLSREQRLRQFLQQFLQETVDNLQREIGRCRELIEKSDSLGRETLRVLVFEGQSSPSLGTRAQGELQGLRLAGVATGLQVTRITEKPTPQTLRGSLRRHPDARHCHLTVQVGEGTIRVGDRGVSFGDFWDCFHNSLIQTVLISGGTAPDLSDGQGVPYLIQIPETVDPDESQFFCQFFWQVIGRRQSPREAFEEACSKIPGDTRERITLSERPS